MTQKLRVVFAGTPEFAAAELAAIHAAGFEVPLVLTQPDRPAGRGMKLTTSPAKCFAVERGLKVAQPTSLRRAGKYPQEAAEAIGLLRATPHDVIVVAAYGLILPQEVLDIPPKGAINIHASLLPRWRGAAPIHRAIEAGDAESGITLMQMDAGLDTGAMIREGRTSIHADDTTATLHDRLAQMGADMIVKTLRDLERDGALAFTPQSEVGTTYAEKIAKNEAALDFRRPAEKLARQIRAFDPFPGAFGTLLDGVAIKLWSAQAIDGAGEPGTIADVSPEGIVVNCGAGALRLTQLQKTGGKRLPVRDFLAGASIAKGQRFHSVSTQR
ncbi:Methionyl-tRNA formyltransferase [Candidatus Burkholderia pumila]|uniref:Methionyl-tRNA formyltransferase n=1 Tax=Candidatus Burkholderia pumila TaxID=1090375 RepID=A0ABR5HKK6_9BURK|nr:Methionyl-tRNA formyltransferase [Candidatus Burkholderia pumila]